MKMIMASKEFLLLFLLLPCVLIAMESFENNEVSPLYTWQIKFGDSIHFLSDGEHIAVASQGQEWIALYSYDGKEQERLCFNGRAACALVRSKVTYAEGHYVTGCEYLETGEKNWVVSLFSRDSEKLAEWDYGPSYIDGNWVVKQIGSPNGRYQAAYKKGPFKSSVVITDTITNETKKWFSVGAPGFSSDSSLLAMVSESKKEVAIYSCEELFSNTDTAR